MNKFDVTQSKIYIGIYISGQTKTLYTNAARSHIHLVRVGNVDRLSVLGDIPDDALSPRHLHLVGVEGAGGGSDGGARVHVEELGHQRPLVRGSLHQEKRAPVRVHQDAHVDQYLVAEVGQVQIVGDVLHQLQEELPLVGLLESVLVVDGAGRVLGHVDPGLQQGAQDVRGGRWQGAGFTQERAAPHAGLRLVLAQAHMLVVGAVCRGGFGPREVPSQLHVGRSAPEPVRVARPQRVSGCAASLLRRGHFGRLMLLQPSGHLVTFRLPDEVLLEEIRVTVQKRLYVREVERCHGEKTVAKVRRSNVAEQELEEQPG